MAVLRLDLRRGCVTLNILVRQIYFGCNLCLGQGGKLNSVTGKVYNEIWLTDGIYSDMTIRWEFCVEFDSGKYFCCVII